MDTERKLLGAQPSIRTVAQVPKTGIFRLVGKGIVSGAADDDPSAIGTYSSAGATFGLSVLWIAPVLLPTMHVVIYISAKIGEVYRKGLFAYIRDQLPRWMLGPLVLLAFGGNIIEAAANLGGMNVIAVVTVLAVRLNLLGFDPMKAWCGRASFRVFPCRRCFPS